MECYYYDREGKQRGGGTRMPERKSEKGQKKVSKGLFMINYYYVKYRKNLRMIEATSMDFNTKKIRTFFSKIKKS